MRNNPIYTTASININNLIFLFFIYIFIYIYIKNSFNFIFVLLNYLIKGILIFIVFTILIFASKAALLLYS